jgi:hypothetical protein
MLTIVLHVEIVVAFSYLMEGALGECEGEKRGFLFHKNYFQPYVNTMSFNYNDFQREGSS